MEISINWNKPLPIIVGSGYNPSYTIADLDSFEDVPGVYMFCRVYSEKLIPRYIGESNNLANRIRQHLKTNLMGEVVNKPPSAGKKVLVMGEFSPKPGQTTDKCIRLVEKALIEHALEKGYDLINLKGTNSPYDDFFFTGSQLVKVFTGSYLYRYK